MYIFHVTTGWTYYIGLMIRYILAETGYFLEIDLVVSRLPKDFKEDLSRMQELYCDAWR